MKKYLVTWALVVCGSLLLTGAASGADDKEEGGLDWLEVEDFEGATHKVSSFVKQLLEERDQQFVKLIDDLVSGNFQQGGDYLKPISQKLDAAVKEFDRGLADRNADKIRRIIIRAKDKKFARLQKKAEASLVARDKVKGDVDSVLEGMVKPEGAGKATLGLAIFNPLGRELAESMTAKCGLLEIISMEKDRLEDFLTGYSRALYDEAADQEDDEGNVVKKGRKRPRLIWSRQRKDTFAIIRLILDGKTFDALRPAREAVESKKYADESHFHLLYAYLQLINESNPKATEEGYGYLKQTYEKLETSKLAYNMVRVGARLDTLDENTMWKLIDHANFNDDDGSLSNLFNLCMVINLRKAEWGTVTKIYEKLHKDPRKAEMLMPAFAFIALLHDGQLERIDAEVDTSKLAELVQAARG